MPITQEEAQLNMLFDSVIERITAGEWTSAWTVTQRTFNYVPQYQGAKRGGWPVNLSLLQYANGGICLRLNGYPEGEPIATASTFLEEPHARQDPRTFWCKDWSENEGMCEFLVKHNIAKCTGRTQSAYLATAIEMVLEYPSEWSLEPRPVELYDDYLWRLTDTIPEELQDWPGVGQALLDLIGELQAVYDGLDSTNLEEYCFSGYIDDLELQSGRIALLVRAARELEQ